MTWKRESYTGREELRFVFDPKVGQDDGEAWHAALDHLGAMADPVAWLREQIYFDADLCDAKKISGQEQSRRRLRWQKLETELKSRAA